MSRLVEHAEREMRLAGLYDKDADYGGMIPEAVMKLVRTLDDQGHSGGSHGLVMSIFNRVANFKTLSPATGDPGEWFEYEPGRFQSVRCPSWFSEDGGKTYNDCDAQDPRAKMPTVGWTQ